jgi:moderate conductance mechanosensitive channel
MHGSFLPTLLAWLCLISVPALAQTIPFKAPHKAASSTTALPDPLTAETARDLVAKMNDDEVRALLLERLDIVAKQEEAKADTPSQSNPLETFFATAADIGDDFSTAVKRLPRLAGGLTTGASNFLHGRGFGGAIQFILFLLLSVLAGLAAEWLLRRSAGRWLQDKSRLQSGENAEKLRAQSYRALVDLAGLVLFTAVARIVISHIMSVPMDRLVAWSFVLQVIVLIRFTSIVFRFFLAPSQPELRLVSADDDTARFIHRNVLVVAGLAGAIQFLVPALDQNGVPMGELWLGWWLNLIAYIWTIVVIWKARAGVTRILIGDEKEAVAGSHKLDIWWPTISIALVILNWVVIEIIANAGRYDLLRGQQNVALALILLTPAFFLAIRGLVSALMPPMTGEGQLAQQAYDKTKRSYVRVGEVTLVVVEVLIVARLWDVRLISLASAGLGEEVASRGVGALIILAVGYLAWEAVNIWAYRSLAATPAPGHGSTSRLATVLPVLRLTAQIAIAVVAVILALGHLGLNVTTLLAGAGIAGIAIGFGAQSLVRDVVSGIFFLADDAFRVGEYVDVGGTMGTVDKISVRSLRLRHHLGPLHVIPYGQIAKLTNMSRDWSIVKLKFTVPFDTDVNKVKRIFNQIGKDLMEFPEMSEALLEPFKFQGVYGYDDVGIVVRGKFMTKAGMQFGVKKEILNRIRKEFEDNGIEFARKEVRVHVPDLDGQTHLDPKRKEAIAAAASQAAEKEAAAG